MVSFEKHDSQMFHRLMIAKDAGFDVDLKIILQLFTAPLSIDDQAGSMRSCTKAVQLHILEKDTAEVAIPTASMSIDGQALSVVDHSDM